MALAELSPGETPVRRTIAEARGAGRNATKKLAEAERLKAEAVAQLVEFDAIDAHTTEGFLTPQRHLIHRAGVIESEANRIQRLVGGAFSLVSDECYPVIEGDATEEEVLRRAGIDRAGWSDVRPAGFTRERS